MGKRVLDVDFEDVEAVKGFSEYTGDTPPKGVYTVTVKSVKLTVNSSGDDMFKFLLLINEPKGSPKAKYNGYAIWWNGNITPKGLPFVADAFDKLGIPRKGAKNIVTAPDDDEVVLKIGGVKVEGLTVSISTRRREWPAGSGEFSLNVGQWLGKPSASEDSESDDEEFDADGDDEPTPPKRSAKAVAKKAAPEPDEDDDEDDDEAF